MKRVKISIILALALSFLSTNVYAALQVIGTAKYQEQDYKLIYMEDGPFGPITWLDYINPSTTWENQKSWASGLGSELTITLNEGYDDTGINWITDWRLPETVDGDYQSGYDGTTTGGYNITSSEMGHLFYKELGNPGLYDTSGNPLSNDLNTGDFDHLTASFYFSGTEYSYSTPAYGSYVWFFNFKSGNQFYNLEFYNLAALAVLPGEVTINPVPIPGAVWLLGSGIVGLAGLRKKFKK
ncbi:MAG: hypothetical protein PVG39_27085 [Desulfobacteraceae bacterium]